MTYELIHLNHYIFEKWPIGWWMWCMHLLYKSIFIKMTIHVSKKILKNSRKGIQMVYVRTNGMWLVFVSKENCLLYMKWYKCFSVYGWYTKVIKKIVFKIYGIQSAIQKFWYMSSIQIKKAIWNCITTFFCCCVFLSLQPSFYTPFWLWILLPSPSLLNICVSFFVWEIRFCWHFSKMYASGNIFPQTSLNSSIFAFRVLFHYFYLLVLLWHDLFPPGIVYVYHFCGFLRHLCNSWMIPCSQLLIHDILLS